MRRIIDQCYTVVDNEFCIYCGVIADCYDHVPPISAFIKNAPAFKFAACTECNSMLSSNSETNLKKRRDYLFKKYYKKYKKVFNMPDWSIEELNELDSSMRTFVINGLKAKAHITARLLKLKRGK